MKLEDLQKALSAFINAPADHGLQLFFVIKEGDILIIYEPALDHQELEPKLKRDFLDQISFVMNNNTEEEEMELMHLNTAEGTDRRTLYHIAATEIPRAKKLFEAIKNEDAILPYAPEEHDLTQVWAVIVKIANASKKLYLFKRNYAVNVIKRGKTYAVFFEKTALQLENKELLKISPKFEFIYLDGELIIVNKDEFETSFEYIHAVEAKANTAIDVVLDSGIMSNASKLYDLSKNRNQIKKILSITKDNPVFKKSPKQIANFAKKYGQIITLSDDKSEIQLKNQKEAKFLLKLFNDDLLLSELSDNKYDSRGKLKIN